MLVLGGAKLDPRSHCKCSFKLCLVMRLVHLQGGMWSFATELYRIQVCSTHTFEDQHACTQQRDIVEHQPKEKVAQALG